MVGRAVVVGSGDCNVMQNGRRIQSLDSWLSLGGSRVGVGVGSMTEVHLDDRLSLFII